MSTFKWMCGENSTGRSSAGRQIKGVGWGRCGGGVTWLIVECRSLIILWTTITKDSHIYVSQTLVSLNMIITCKQSIKLLIFMIYNVLVVFYNNKYIFDFSDFLLPQTPGATYMIHMTNSLNYCNFFLLFFFCLFMTKSLLFYDKIIFFLMWCILRLSRVKLFYWFA